MILYTISQALGSIKHHYTHIRTLYCRYGSNDTPKKPKSFSELEKLRAEVESIMGPDRLNYTAGEQAEFFFQHSGDTELVHIKPNGLAKILTEARKVLQKKDAGAAAHVPDAPQNDGTNLFK